MEPFIGIGLYVRDSVNAVKIYQEAFGLTLGYHVLNDDGTFFHSELDKEGKTLLAVVQSSAPAGQNNPVQLGFTFDTEAELVHAFDLLKQGGAVLMERCELPWSPCAAEVADRFGIRWYLTLQQHRPDEDFSPRQLDSATDTADKAPEGKRGEVLSMDEKAILDRLHALGIPELETVQKLNPLPGAYINLACRLPDGTTAKILDDAKSYYGTQVEKSGGDRCYGVAADASQIAVFEYGCNGSDAELAAWIKL